MQHFTKMRFFTQNTCKALFKIVLSIALLLLILNKFDSKSILPSIQKVSFVSVVLSLILVWLANALMAFRWQWILLSQQAQQSQQSQEVQTFQNPQISNHQISFHVLWKLTNMGQFFNQTMPSSIGGDLARIWLLNNQEPSLSLVNTTSSVVLERLFGFVTLGLLLLMGLGFEPSIIEDATVQWPFIVSASFFLVSILFILIVPYVPLTWLNFRKVFFLNFLSAFLQSIQNMVKSIHFNKTLILKLIAVSIVIHLLHISVIRILSQAVGFEFPWIVSFIAVPIIFLIIALPISFAGWGVREGITVLILKHFDILGEEALSMSFLYGILLFLASLPGFVYWILNKSSAKASLSTH